MRSWTEKGWTKWEGVVEAEFQVVGIPIAVHGSTFRCVDDIFSTFAELRPQIRPCFWYPRFMHYLFGIRALRVYGNQQLKYKSKINDKAQPCPSCMAPCILGPDTSR